MARHLALGGVLTLLAVVGPGGQVTHAAQASVPIIQSDYGPAEWVPANPANFTVSNRPQRYQVNFIVIHDIEGSVDDAIAAFQDPNRAGSAHYIVGEAGGVWQMVLEKDIAWHAGNWDYNTRAIGIEHEGFACCDYYTTAEYDTSARLAASICSRWGVPLDRSHVIGHSEVPDPNNPGLFGGEDHHTDPGPYWDWSYYMGLAQSYASSLPSPPHMGPNPIAKSEEGSVMLSWQPAQSCRLPIGGYQIVGQPGNITLNVPATQTSAWITGLTDGTSYSFTVTATNADGQSSLTSNAAVPGQACSSAQLATSTGSPQLVGTSITVTATSAGCNTPEYAFWLRTPDGTWTQQQFYSSNAAWTWNTAGFGQGTFQLGVWARQVSDGHSYDTYALNTFTLGGATCVTGAITPSAAPPQPSGTVVTFTASSTGCAAPQYQFWLLPPDGQWTVVQPYSTATTWLFNSGQYPAGGNFQVGIWVRQASSTNAYDAFYVTTYWIRGAGGCVTSGLTPSAAPPQAVGAQLTFTPQQAGCTGQYRFWLLPPGGQWTIVQDFGSASTWGWNTAGYGPGVYQVGVWERNAGSPNAYDSYAITTFTLGVATCGSASLTSNVASPQAPGTSVTFTAASTGCAAPSYQFWLLGPGGSWTIQRPYGSASWTWNTNGLSPGTYQVGVWARQAGSTSAYDSWYITSYKVSGPSCASAALAASPASPQTAGTPITLTASTTGCTSPLYQFVVQAPGGPWTIAQGFSPQATFIWNTSGAARGSYNVAVWAVASGSLGDFDVYSMVLYAIS